MNESELPYFFGIYCVPGLCETLYACHLFMFYCPSPLSPSNLSGFLAGLPLASFTPIIIHFRHSSQN